MIVISDTTPLISLMKIGHLDVLEKLFGEIVIPGAVYNELTSTNKFKEEALAVRNCPFLKVVEVTDFGGSCQIKGRAKIYKRVTI